MRPQQNHAGRQVLRGDRSYSVALPEGGRAAEHSFIGDIDHIAEPRLLPYRLQYRGAGLRRLSDHRVILTAAQTAKFQFKEFYISAHSRDGRVKECELQRLFS